MTTESKASPRSFADLAPDTKNAIKAVFAWYREKIGEPKTSAPTTLERRRFLEILADLEDNETVEFAKGDTRDARLFLKNGSCPSIDRLMTDEVYQPESEAKSDGEKQLQFVVWRGSLAQGEVDLFCVTRDEMRGYFNGLDAETGLIRATAFRLAPDQWRDVYRLIRKDEDPADYAAFVQQLVGENWRHGSNAMITGYTGPPSEGGDVKEETEEEKQIAAALAASIAAPTPSQVAFAGEVKNARADVERARLEELDRLRRQLVSLTGPRRPSFTYALNGDEFRRQVNVDGLTDTTHDPEAKRMQDLLRAVAADSKSNVDFVALVTDTSEELKSWAQIAAVIAGDKVPNLPLFRINRIETFEPDGKIAKVTLLNFIAYVAHKDLQRQVYKSFVIDGSLLSASQRSEFNPSVWSWSQELDGLVRVAPIWMSQDKKSALIRDARQREDQGGYITYKFGSFAMLDYATDLFSVFWYTPLRTMIVRLSGSRLERFDAEDTELILSALDDFPSSSESQYYATTKQIDIHLEQKPTSSLRIQLEQHHYVPTNAEELEWRRQVPYVSLADRALQTEVKREVQENVQELKADVAAAALEVKTPTPSATAIATTATAATIVTPQRQAERQEIQQQYRPEPEVATPTPSGPVVARRAYAPRRVLAPRRAQAARLEPPVVQQEQDDDEGFTDAQIEQLLRMPTISRELRADLLKIKAARQLAYAAEGPF